jgi:predicted TIM-barrel fold metal-dependent hydrolase
MTNMEWDEMADTTLETPRPYLYEHLALPKDRKAESPGRRALPPGTVLVSADNHYSLLQDIFYENFPSRLKDKAPRIVLDKEGFGDWLVDGQSIFKEGNRAILSCFDQVRGASDIEARMADLEQEGVSKEIVFPNSLLAVVAAPQLFPSLEVRDLIVEIYNDHLADLQAAAPGKFYGVGIINHGHAPGLRGSLQRLKDRGIRTIILPIYPKDATGRDLDYCSEEMIPFWEAIEEADLPVCFHIAESVPATAAPGGMGVSVMANLSPLRKTMGQLIFGGILDRHPTLQAVFVECDINWVPGAMQSAAVVRRTYDELLSPKLKREPWEYWHENLYATFMHDPAGLKLIDQIGADRVMWSTDYPHMEGVFGAGWSAVEEVLSAVSPQDATKILGKNAIDLFSLH